MAIGKGLMTPIISQPATFSVHLLSPCGNYKPLSPVDELIVGVTGPDGQEVNVLFR